MVYTPRKDFPRHVTQASGLPAVYGKSCAVNNLRAGRMI